VSHAADVEHACREGATPFRLEWRDAVWTAAADGHRAALVRTPDGAPLAPEWRDAPPLGVVVERVVKAAVLLGRLRVEALEPLAQLPAKWCAAVTLRGDVATLTAWTERKIKRINTATRIVTGGVTCDGAARGFLRPVTLAPRYLVDACLFAGGADVDVWGHRTDALAAYLVTPAGEAPLAADRLAIVMGRVP